MVSVEIMLAIIYQIENVAIATMDKAEENSV